MPSNHDERTDAVASTIRRAPVRGIGTLAWRAFTRVSTFLMLGAASVAGAAPVTLSAPDGHVLRVAPGGVTTLRLRVQGTHAFHASLYVAANGGANDYLAFGQPAPGCPALPVLQGSSEIDFDPTLANGNLVCSYEISRSAFSIHDLQFHLSTFDPNVPVTWIDFVLGKAPELDFWTRQETFERLPDGRARGRVRLTYSNRSDVPIWHVHADHCSNLIPNDLVSAINGNIAGGCGPMDMVSDICPGFALAELWLPQVGPHATASCLVEVTSLGTFVATERYAFDLHQWFMSNPSTGGYLYPARTPETRWITLSEDPSIFAHDFD